MLKRRPVSRRMVEPLESRLLLSAAELIRNGGFEGTVSSADWVLTGNFQADSRFTNVHTGSGYAYLANTDGSSGNSISGTLYQQVTIPSSASSATLNFWTKITTSETTTTAANDVMTVQVMNSTGTSLLQSAATYSNLNASSSYVQRTISLDRALIGQTVRLVFSASTNASLATTFRVDDVSLNAVTTASNNRVVGYLPYYRQSTFSKVDLSLLTHINYFSVTINSDGSLSNPNVTASNLNAVVAAAHAAGVTVSITVGPVSFSTLAASSAARVAFANNIVNFALTYNLDGIDIDWEPPAGNNVTNYGYLINDLYAVAHPQHMLITAAVNPWTNEIPVTPVNTKMDWLNVMCYDFAPANHSTYTDAVSGMTDWTAYGVQKNKIVMGLPFYGKAGSSWSNDVSKTYSGILGDYASLHSGAFPSLDTDSYVASDGKTYYFNGVTTTEKKVAYVRDNGYGGMMIWELGQDYWNGSSAYTPYSLLPVLGSMMNPPAWLAASPGSRFDLVGNTLYVHAGTVTLSSDLFTANPNLNVIVSSGATLSINSTQHLASLTVADGGSVAAAAGGSNTLVVTSLNLNTTGKLDLKNNSLIVNYTGSSPAASLVGRLYAGRNAGAWNGNGLFSSTAAADAAKTTAIGYADASDLGRTTFAGQSVDSTSLLFRYTYYGDTDLSGSVTADDLARTDRGSAKSLTNWLWGDFDYTASVTSADYTLINKAFAAHGALIPEPTAPASEPAGILATEPTITPIPEPSPAPEPLVTAEDSPAIPAAAVADTTPTPTITLAGPARAKARKAVTFRIVLPPATATATSTKIRPVRYAIDWDDDGQADQIITARPGSVLRIRHTYRKAGVYHPTVRAIGTTTTTASRPLKIRIA